ncbi:MAG: nucleotide exchange factor GrpE [Ignavibacteria bacterium]|nr:nucleotide exchange factor GrpE [Ignavibacteria bacterium]
MSKNKNTEEKENLNVTENPETITDETQENEALSETDKLKKENAELRELLLRKAAEFENYKKRREAESAEFVKYSSERIIKELIPVYDDMDRSLHSVNKGETKDLETLKQGLELVYQKFKGVLQSEGLQELDVLGKPFDVNTSDALLQVPKEVEPNTVIEVVEKGYSLKDKVIKHAKVLVSA